MEFINLKAQYTVLKQQIDDNIQEIIEKAQFIGGSQVKEFEEKLAKYVGRKYCITCGSGTDALQLAYMAYGVGKGDAVFCPDMTFIASIEPAVLLGATPIFCDIEEDTYNLCPVSLERQIKKVIEEGHLKPKAVVSVDFLGNPAKIDEISAICKKYNIIMIEDGAQSMGASYKGRKCCSFGDIATTSFFPSKPLGCYGDGGAVFTDNEHTAELIESYKVHGKGPLGKYHNVRIGINSRLDTMQAGVLLPKLEILEDEISKRQMIAQRYNEALGDILQIPRITSEGISSYAQYCVLAENSKQRENIIEHLKKKDIPSLIYYPTQLHTLEAFVPCRKLDFPNAKKYAECNFGLPFSPYMTKVEQDLVIESVKELLK